MGVGVSVIDMSKGAKGEGSWRTIDAVETSIRLLETLRDMGGAGVTELADETGVSKAGVHSHLNTLRENELVVKNGDEYNISLRFLDFGEYAKQNLHIYDLVEAEVHKLAHQTDEVAQFMVEEHGWGVYTHKARGENAVQTRSYIGNRKHLHCTAVGKAILSELPDERIDEIVDKNGLPGNTENTITTRDELFAEVAEVRESGVAFDDEEALQGLRCVAVPVKDQRGELLGAISVSGPTNRIKNERFSEELPEAVKNTANVIQINAAQL